MTRHSFDLVVVGHLLKERIVFADGREIGPVLGGPAAYAAVAAARLGLKVGLMTRIGTDMPGELMKVFDETGVDAGGVLNGDTTTADRLIYDSTGNKRLEFQTKAALITRKDIPESYLNAGWFLVAPIDGEIGPDVFSALSENGKHLSAELSGFGGASSSRNTRILQGDRLKFLKKVAPYCEIFKGGLEDIHCLFGDISPDEAARQFIDWGAKTAIVTLGSRGALILACHCEEQSDEAISIPAFPVKVADTTGAGDAWHAGFLCAYLKTGDLSTAAAFASAVAGLVIEGTGGVRKERFPDYLEVTRFIRTAGSCVSASAPVHINY